MSLLPDSASFHERVQDCFVAYRGRGVSLSATDLELVDAWAAAEVPFEVVARGIRSAAERAMWHSPEGAPTLRFVSWCRRDVQTEIDKYLKRTTQLPSQAEPTTTKRPKAPFHLVRHRKLLAALRAIEPQPTFVVRWVEDLDEPADLTQAGRNEETALALLARTLPFTDRLRLLREARRLVQNAEPLSATARRESLRFHRAARVRHALSVPAFW